MFVKPWSCTIRSRDSLEIYIPDISTPFLLSIIVLQQDPKWIRLHNGSF